MNLRYLQLSAAVAVLAAVLVPWEARATQGTMFSPPGVYGRIDTTRYPNPKTVTPRQEGKFKGLQRKQRSIYLWIPASHRLQWTEYCIRYVACKSPVAFVTDEWYFHDGPGKGLGSEEHHDHEH